jgi:hypothetical protein
MSITFTLEPKDMRGFLAHNRKHRPANRRLRYMMLLIFAVLSFQNAMARHQDTTRRVIDFFVAFALYLIVFWIVRNVVTLLTQWKSFTSKEQPGLFCEHTITLTEKALIEVTPVNEATNLWLGLHSVTDTPQYIFIFVAANAAHIIPKQAFKNPETADAFFKRAFQLWSDAKRPTLTTSS